MPSLAGSMRSIDAKIFARIGEVLLIGSTRVPGIFSNKYHEIQLPSDTIVGLDVSFDCQYTYLIGQLKENDEVKVFADKTLLGTFRFIRRIPSKGDETGKVILELGSV
jgi:hypothetical protein